MTVKGNRTRRARAGALGVSAGAQISSEPGPTERATRDGALTPITRRHLLAGLVLAPFVFRHREAGADVGSKGPQAMPGYLEPFTDPAIGSSVIRVTDPTRSVPGLALEWSKVARHHYSIDQAWNADQSLILLDRGTKLRVFLDARTYRPVFARRLPGEVRWHPSNPGSMIYVATREVGLWDVAKDRRATIWNSKDYIDLEFGGHKGNPSDSGRLIAVTARRSDTAHVVFAIDLETGEKRPDIDVSAIPGVRHVTISPAGGLVLVASGDGEPYREVKRIFTIDGQLQQTWHEHERPGHGDLAIDTQGDEVYIGRSKSPPDQWCIIKRRLIDGKVATLSPRCFAMHVSARNIRRPGWVLATYSKGDDRPGYAPLRDEIAFVSIDGTHQVQRLAKVNAAPDGYVSEPHGSPSPDGTRAIFASNWNHAGGPIASFVATLPA